MFCRNYFTCHIISVLAPPLPHWTGEKETIQDHEPRVKLVVVLLIRLLLSSVRHVMRVVSVLVRSFCMYAAMPMRQRVTMPCGGDGCVTWRVWARGSRQGRGCGGGTMRRRYQYIYTNLCSPAVLFFGLQGLQKEEAKEGVRPIGSSTLMVGLGDMFLWWEKCVGIVS